MENFLIDLVNRFGIMFGILLMLIYLVITDIYFRKDMKRFGEEAKEANTCFYNLLHQTHEIDKQVAVLHNTLVAKLESRIITPMV